MVDEVCDILVKTLGVFGGYFLSESYFDLSNDFILSTSSKLRVYLWAYTSFKLLFYNKKLGFYTENSLPNNYINNKFLI